MKPEINIIILDRLSVSGEGVNELVGRIFWSHPGVSDEAKACLRLSKRGTADYVETAGKLEDLSEAESQFSLQMNVHQEDKIEYEDILDVYLVIRSTGSESVHRVAWPQIAAPWMAYPTIYGNLSIKKNIVGVSDS